MEETIYERVCMKVDEDAIKKAIATFEDILGQAVTSLKEDMGVAVAVAAKASKSSDEDEDEDDDDVKPPAKVADEDDDDMDEDEDDSDEDDEEEKSERFFPTLEEIDALSDEDVTQLCGVFGEKFAKRAARKQVRTQKKLLKYLVSIAEGDEHEPLEKIKLLAAKYLGVNDEAGLKEAVTAIKAGADKNSSSDSSDDEDDDEDEEEAPKAKPKAEESDDDDEDSDEEAEEEEKAKPVKRAGKRGRPPGSKNKPKVGKGKKK